MPQELALYGDLTARENLPFFGELYGLRGADLRRQADEVLAAIGLADRADDRADTFSGGMKRRLNLGVALVHRPRLLLLDEPTVGVDPQSRNHIFEEVRRLNARGRDGRLHQPLHGGGAGAVPPHRHHRPRPAGRLRHPAGPAAAVRGVIRCRVGAVTPALRERVKAAARRAPDGAATARCWSWSAAT